MQTMETIVTMDPDHIDNDESIQSWNDDEPNTNGYSDRRRVDQIQVSRMQQQRQPSLSTCDGQVDEEKLDEEEPESKDMKEDSEAMKRVFYLKSFVVMILIISAIIIAVVTYRYITKSEEKQFVTKFHNDAEKVFESIGSSLDRTLGTMNAIAVTLVSFAFHQGDEWPFVSLPEFALHASKLIPLTDGLFLSILPIVKPQDKNKWERYSYFNDKWVNESLAIQEVWDGYHGEITYDWARSETIHGDFAVITDNVSRFMLPQWQSFPIAPEEGYAVYNWDWNSESNPASIQTAITKQLTVLSESYMIANPNNPEANAEMAEWARANAAYLPPGENSFEPMLDVNYPIVNDISPTAVLKKGNITSSSNQTVVGVIAMPIYWRSFFRSILAEGSNGIVVVVRNPCNEPFTYQINGPQVTYLGVGDRHSAKYDAQAAISSLVDLHSFTLRDSAYSGAPIDVEFCPYTLHVYPSDTMKADYMTQDATTFLVAVLLIFLFTSGVFFVYDWYVGKRQYRTESAAIRASAIVSSLFPSTVRDLLYKSTQEVNAKRTLTTDDDNCNTSPNVASPIAQAYSNTTVLFADIVGFTSWCSSREPSQVFHLLETLYAGFDALAKLRGVFKIETIGDSYVAVVGLPKSRKRHAVVMAKFANDIRAKMIELTAELEDCLGPGTSSLALRIGLNSGPTTAGVLRGEKARFQLFGDTVNTAARMETNSEPFRIHVSESTADLIIAADKGHWLEPREEKIDIKGKGLMQTYWCNPSVDAHWNDESSSHPLNVSEQASCPIMEV